MYKTKTSKINNLFFKSLIFLLFILNIVDTYATIYWITENLAYEKNPLMQEWLNLSPVLFSYIKLIFVSLASIYLWKVIDRKLTQILIIPIVLLYIYVFVLHCNIAYEVFYN